MKLLKLVAKVIKGILFSDDCSDASDCGNNGECVDIQATGFPTKQCFCNPGWFGKNCSRSEEFCII